MLYMLAAVPLCAVLMIWMVFKWREYDATQKKQSASRATKNARFSRAEPVRDDGGRKASPKQPRAFGRR